MICSGRKVANQDEKIKFLDTNPHRQTHDNNEVGYQRSAINNVAVELPRFVMFPISLV